VDLRKPDEDVDALLGARLARRFAGDARRLAHAARLLVLTDDVRPRTLLYRPPPFAGGTGAVVLPDGTPSAVATAMLAVAVGLHLDGTPRPTSYAAGDLIGPTRPRHRAAVRFAHGFMRASSHLSTEIAPRDRRAS
jgi:hypothetical protein